MRGIGDPQVYNSVNAYAEKVMDFLDDLEGEMGRLEGKWSRQKSASRGVFSNPGLQAGLGSYFADMRKDLAEIYQKAEAGVLLAKRQIEAELERYEVEKFHYDARPKFISTDMDKIAAPEKSFEPWLADPDLQ